MKTHNRLICALLLAATGSLTQAAERSEADAELHQRRVELRAEDQRAERERADRLEAAFHAEGEDRAWAEATETSVRAALASGREFGALQARSLVCRSRSCRLELFDDGSNELQTALPLLALRLASALPRISAAPLLREGESPALALYLSR
jgi:hypothetical protein